MPAVHRRRGGWTTWAIVLVALSLFGQGETYRVDPRFRTPSSTLIAYWEALRTDDAEGAWECQQEGPYDRPFPGMLWILPPLRDLHLQGFQSVPVTAGRIMVTYEVRFHPAGSDEEQSLLTGSELVRTRGEWRILRPLGNVNLSDWHPIARSASI